MGLFVGLIPTSLIFVYFSQKIPPLSRTVKSNVFNKHIGDNQMKNRRSSLFEKNQRCIKKKCEEKTQKCYHYYICCGEKINEWQPRQTNVSRKREEKTKASEWIFCFLFFCNILWLGINKIDKKKQKTQQQIKQ